MKKPTPALDAVTAPALALAMPSSGGSYVRKGDGSLERMEFTDDAPAPAEEPEQASTASEQEG